MKCDCAEFPRFFVALSKPWRRFSEITIMTIIIATPLIGHVAVGLYFNWSPMETAISRPPSEGFIDIGVILALALTVSAPATLALRHNMRGSYPEVPA